MLASRRATAGRRAYDVERTSRRRRRAAIEGQCGDGAEGRVRPGESRRRTRPAAPARWSPSRIQQPTLMSVERSARALGEEPVDGPLETNPAGPQRSTTPRSSCRPADGRRRLRSGSRRGACSRPARTSRARVWSSRVPRSRRSPPRSGPERVPRSSAGLKVSLPPPRVLIARCDRLRPGSGRAVVARLWVGYKRLRRTDGLPNPGPSRGRRRRTLRAPGRSPAARPARHPAPPSRAGRRRRPSDRGSVRRGAAGYRREVAPGSRLQAAQGARACAAAPHAWQRLSAGGRA